MTDEEEAMLWLNDKAAVTKYACTIGRILAEPRMPIKPRTRLLDAILRGYCLHTGHINPGNGLAHAIYNTLYVELSAPETKEVEAWHVEYAQSLGGDWWPQVIIFNSKDEAQVEAQHKLKHPTVYKCVAITGPHIHKMPA